MEMQYTAAVLEHGDKQYTVRFDGREARVYGMIPGDLAAQIKAREILEGRGYTVRVMRLGDQPDDDEVDLCDPAWLYQYLREQCGAKVTPTGCRLLSLLMSRMGRPVHRDTINQALHGDRPDPPHDKIINVYVHHLRRALIGTPYQILTRGHHGYELIMQEEKQCA